MKRFGLTVFGVLLASPALAEDINETLSADPRGEVSISNTAGSVEVRGWSRDEVEVTGRLGDDVEELIFERDGDEILIKVKGPNRYIGRKDISSDLVVRVPEKSSLDIGTVSANIEVQDVHGELELASVSGRIDTQVYSGDLEAGTVSGSIDVQGDDEVIDAELSSVSGSISAAGLAGDLEAESVSGRVSVSGGLFESVDMETVNGRITFRGQLHDDGDMAMESVNGGVDIDIENNVPARYEIETFNGGIKNCFGVRAERTSRYAPGYSLSHEVGAASASVRVETLNGSVNFCAGK
ncbi:MAG: DUF4097 family beta strand repeat-containing protein [Pseudomonadota bacterium]